MPEEVSPAASDPTSAREGAFFAILSALLFGLSAPLAKRILEQATGPVLLAGLFYLGGGLGLSVHRIFARPEEGRALRLDDGPILGAVILLGGILGPALMMLGLELVDATPGSLLLNLEAPLTMLIAVVAFRERLSLRAVVAGVLIVGGATVIGLPRDEGLEASPTGIFYLAGACAVWALDTNLMRVLSRRDPFAVSRVKTIVAGSVNVVVGLALDAWRLPDAATLTAALAVGFFSYGVSTVLVTMALRRIGAARHAALFATAPFFGAIAAIPLLGEPLTTPNGFAMLLMALGVAILLRERSMRRAKPGARGATLESP